MSAPIEAAKNVTKTVVNVVEAASHAHSIFDLFKVVFKGEKPSENTKMYVKGLYGLVGHGDEQAMEALLGQLEEEEGYAGSRHVIAAFLKSIFPAGTPAEWALSKVYGNKFRVFLTGVGSIDAHKESTEVSTTKEGNTTTVKTVDVYGHGFNGPINFLKFMYDTLKVEVDPTFVGPINLKQNYPKLSAYFQGNHIPHIPEGWVKEANKIWANMPELKYKDIKEGAKKQYRASCIEITRNTVLTERKVQTINAKPRSWLGKLIRWF